MENLISTIQNAAGNGINIIDYNYTEEDVYVPDLSENNQELEQIDLDNPDEMNAWLKSKTKQHEKSIAIGGYGEDRMVYKRSRHFGMGPEARSIHLGIDLWIDAGTGVLAPFDATVHSFQNNDNHGDYGGTIILQHQIKNATFYTLYGHLALSSLEDKQEGQHIGAGTIFAYLGTPDENGGWPPHLHFQLIRDMGNHKGDYFGVANYREREQMMYMCPNPNYILKLKILT